jgi:hypothetical protein
MQQTTACDALYIAVTAPGIDGYKCATAWKPAAAPETADFLPIL